MCEREARRVFANGSDRDDAVQAALLRVWTHRRSCRSGHAPEAWVARIARREAYRLAASQRLERGRPPAPVRERPAEPTLDPVLDRIHAYEVVQSLPPTDQRILVLRFFGDMTHAQVSEALGMPVGTVKVRMHRMRRRLREPAA